MLTKSLFDGKNGFVNKKKNENVRKWEDAAVIVGEQEKSVEKREKSIVRIARKKVTYCGYDKASEDKEINREIQNQFVQTEHKESQY